MARLLFAGAANCGAIGTSIKERGQRWSYTGEPQDRTGSKVGESDAGQRLTMARVRCNIGVWTLGVQMTPQKKDAQFKLRLPQQLLKAAKTKADAEDIPLSQIIRQFLREWVSKSPKPHAKKK